MNKKGQALVEFVLILPVLIFMLFAIVDFGNIFYSRYDLQNKSTDIARLLLEGRELVKVESIYKDYEIDVSLYKEDYQLITITKEVSLITPGLDLIFDNPYIIKVERIITNENT